MGDTSRCSTSAFVAIIAWYLRHSSGVSVIGRGVAMIISCHSAPARPPFIAVWRSVNFQAIENIEAPAGRLWRRAATAATAYRQSRRVN